MNAIKNITIGNTDRLKKPVGFTILSNLVNVVPFMLSIEVVNTIFKAFNGSEMGLDIEHLWIIFGIAILYMIVMALTESKSYSHNFRGAYLMSADGRIKLAEHLRKLSLGTIYNKDPGDMAGMIISDFTLAETGISHHLPQLIGALVMPILAFLSLLWINWQMSVAMFIALPIAVIILIAINKLQVSLGKKLIQAKINAGSRLEEYLQGIRIIKAYNMLGSKFERLKNSFEKLKKISMTQEAAMGPFMLLSIAFVRSGLTLMILLGSYLLIGGELNLMTFVMFLIVGSRVFDPLTSALTNFAEFKFYALAGGRILNLMNEPEMTGNKDCAESGDISFENVSFGYGKKIIIKNLSVIMKKGTLTALVGPSGSGKSTMMKLCARFYDPQKGRILFSGENIVEMDPELYMKHISMVFQDVYLFQDTIKNNIRFGNTNATDAEIIEATKQACCHDFINKLPNGYNTIVGEGGCTLSGGEKQRISIARAILKNAPIVLLDEATASLDPENEVEVQRAINKLIIGRTVIVIAHQLKTIKNADNIIVLENGLLKEQGKHDELIANKSLYFKLWNIQKEMKGW